MGVLENEEGSRQCWWTLRNAAGAVTDIVPAVVVHQAHGRVTLTVTCDAGDGTTSELTVQITPEQWRALPASSATDLRMVNESAASCDALQLTMPNSPSLMHLIRRRYHLGLRTTRLGSYSPGPCVFVCTTPAKKSLGVPGRGFGAPVLS